MRISFFVTLTILIAPLMAWGNRGAVGAPETKTETMSASAPTAKPVAKPNAKVEVSLDEGYRLVLDGPNLSLVRQGKAIWSSVLDQAEAGQRGELVKHMLADGLMAVHVRSIRTDGKVIEAVVVKKAGRSKAEVVWQAITGLSGDIGEGVGESVRFYDLTGDGLPEIAVGEVSQMVRLCGQTELPLLFRKVYDPIKRVFRSVLAKRPGLKTPVELQGRVGTGEAPSPLDQVTPSGASRSAGDGNHAISLLLPREAVDRDPKTAWIPFPSNGAGEFASFRLSSNAYGITRIGIRSLPEASAPGKLDRPRSLIAATEKGVYRLQFPEDPEKQPARIVWFDLPKPDKSGCLSVIVESSFAPSSDRLLPLAELFVETEIDGPGGLDRLASDLKDRGVRRQAAELLKKARAAAVPALRKIWPSLDTQGRRLAADVLSDAAPEQSIDLLILAVLGGDKVAEKLAMRGLDRAPEAAVAALSKHLASAKTTVFEQTVRVLAMLGTESALDALVRMVGEGSRTRRAFLIEQLALAASKSDDLTEKLWSHVAEAEAKGAREKLFDLLRAADDFPLLKDRADVLARSLYDSSNTFADRYRALESLGSTGCDTTGDRLLAASSDKDTHIRVVALAGLAPCASSDQAALLALRRALADKEPLVRLTALSAFSKPRIAHQAIFEAKTLAANDPWPAVRASTAVMAGHLAPTEALPILDTAMRDPAPTVREAAIESAAPLVGTRIDQLIEGRLAAADELAKIKEKAALAAGKRCQKSALPLLLEVLMKGAEPMAAEDDIRAAAAAAAAMGHIGGPDAKARLEKAKSRSNPRTDKAIALALKNPGTACAGGR